jgi:phosphonate transport system ATP-binding protein
MGATAPALVFDGVTKRFDEEPVLSDLSLRVEAGERVAIVGPSGTGKTTLLRLANGALQPDAGSVRFAGDPVSTASVALVYQGNTLVGRRSVLANVLSGGLGRLSWLRGYLEPLVPSEPARARSLIADVGLADKADARADTLSAGERQRAALARALMRDTPVLLADEPTANLDPTTRSTVIDVLEANAGPDRVFITVLHETELARERFERVVGLADGTVQFDLPAAEVTDAQLQSLFDDRADSDANTATASPPAVESCTEIPWYA